MSGIVRMFCLVRRSPALWSPGVKQLWEASTEKTCRLKVQSRVKIRFLILKIKILFSLLPKNVHKCFLSH